MSKFNCEKIIFLLKSFKIFRPKYFFLNLKSLLYFLMQHVIYFLIPWQRSDGPIHNPRVGKFFVRSFEEGGSWGDTTPIWDWLTLGFPTLWDLNHITLYVYYHYIHPYSLTHLCIKELLEVDFPFFSLKVGALALGGNILAFESLILYLKDTLSKSTKNIRCPRWGLSEIISRPQVSW